MTDDEARIKARYPGASRTDYVLGAIAGLAVLAAVALVIITGVRNSNPAVAAMVRSFDVVSATELTAELVIQRRDPSVPVECRVSAQAPSFEKVAETTIEVPSGEETLTSLEITLVTIKEATAVSIEGCRTIR